jgi:uroporphyrinogen-III synthase
MSKDYDSKTLLENLEKLSVVSIGPFTSDELKKFNVKNTVAEVHTVAGAFDAMKSTLTIT